MPNYRNLSIATQSAVTLLGHAIQHGRKAKGWSETELAERLGASRYTVRRLEAGETGTGIGLMFEAANLVGVMPVVPQSSGRLSTEAAYKPALAFNDDF